MMARASLFPAESLCRRLVAEADVSAGALMLPRKLVDELVARAMEHGARIAIAQAYDVRHCRVCGCTELTACRPEPCAWAAADLCTACEPYLEDPDA